MHILVYIVFATSEPMPDSQRTNRCQVSSSTPVTETRIRLVNSFVPELFTHGTSEVERILQTDLVPKSLFVDPHPNLGHALADDALLRTRDVPTVDWNADHLTARLDGGPVGNSTRLEAGDVVRGVTASWVGIRMFPCTAARTTIFGDPATVIHANARPFNRTALKRMCWVSTTITKGTARVPGIFGCSGAFDFGVASLDPVIRQRTPASVLSDSVALVVIVASPVTTRSTPAAALSKSVALVVVIAYPGLNAVRVVVPSRCPCGGSIAFLSFRKGDWDMVELLVEHGRRCLLLRHVLANRRLRALLDCLPVLRLDLLESLSAVRLVFFQDLCYAAPGVVLGLQCHQLLILLLSPGDNWVDR